MQNQILWGYLWKRLVKYLNTCKKISLFKYQKYFHDKECDCNEDGSDDCMDDGYCICKENVSGLKCDSCTEDAFGFPECLGKYKKKSE